MDDIFEKYIESMVMDCLSSVGNNRVEELRGYFLSLTIDVFLNCLDENQLREVQKLDLKNDQDLEKLEEISSSIPGFAVTLDEILKDAAAEIKQSKQIPEV